MEDTRPPSGTNLPLVSVIIPCYNSALYLKDSIDSVLAQTYPSLEILVIDDGSTDDSQTVLSSYGNRIQIIAQANAGVSAARNTGIAAAKGDVVAMMDADDAMDPTCIEVRMKHMLSDERVGIVAGSYRVADEQLNPYPPESQFTLPTVSLDARTSLRICNSPNIGLLIRKRAILVCGLYDPFLKAAEDWDMQIRICQSFKHVFDPTILATYRQVPTSATRSSLRFYDDGRRVLKKARVYCGGGFQTWIDTQVGLFHHTVGGVFGVILSRPEGKWKPLLQFLSKRPSAIVFLLAGFARKVKNKLTGGSRREA